MRWLLLPWLLSVMPLATAIFCNRPTEYHTNNKLEERCCIPVKCMAGTYAALCKNDGDQARCILCRKDRFMPSTQMSTEMRHCFQKKPCHGYRETIVFAGNETHDRVCGCDLKNGYYNQSSPDHDPCIRKKCEAGMELTSDGRCKPCRSGYFKPEANYEPCLKKKDCDHKYASHGNATHDVVCEEKATRASIKESKRKENDPIDWTVVVVIGIILVAVILICCLSKSCRKCNPPADSREEKGMLPRSSTSSTPDSSLSYEVNRVECNAQYRPPSSVFSSLTESSLPDNASTHTVVVENMPSLEHPQTATKQKHLFESSLPDHLLETDCVEASEDETLLKSSPDNALCSAETSRVAPKKTPNHCENMKQPLNTAHSTQTLQIDTIKNCTLVINMGDKNKVEVIKQNSQSDSGDESYDIHEKSIPN
ncbi:hypothetical protein CAPTEDRAFT_225929 [Capitella teleta]|uniref:TNFR-Cys domain-containing protein n=1 Tax=Capitella teleta TaxID=283909 RepID=R7UTP5_CAPTE|nr:hypothetical protein CAPTEDRAFT_225929 [Capitella teleta]|eukprot:ELU09894.1 hypothetical protein CAPTEDRAFT_225929 [Capitella teleta]